MTSSGRDRAAGSGWLVCLTLVMFVIGTDDFIIAGVLPQIAHDQGVSEAAAGQLVTVFSLTYAVAAPPLAVATARLPRRPLVTGGLVVFAGVNLVTALAPTFAALVGLRVTAALVAATITPAVFVIAARAAPPDRVGRAVGTVAAGLTVSLFVGVPLGSLLGTVGGWRATFLAVALLTTVVVLASVRLLPALPGARETGVRAQLGLLLRPAVLTCVLGTTLGASGGLLVYTYIGPISRGLSGRTEAVALNTSGLYVGIALAGAVGGGALARFGAAGAAAAAAVICLVTVLVMATFVRRYPSHRPAVKDDATA